MADDEVALYVYSDEPDWMLNKNVRSKNASFVIK